MLSVEIFGKRFLAESLSFEGDHLIVLFVYSSELLNLLYSKQARYTAVTGGNGQEYLQAVIDGVHKFAVDPAPMV